MVEFWGEPESSGLQAADFSGYPHVVEREGASFLVSSYEGTNRIWEAATLMTYSPPNGYTS